MSNIKPRRKRKRRVPVALPASVAEADGIEFGPAMRALKTDRHRNFVLALYQVPPGFGAQVNAARLAGWGYEDSTPETMQAIASRLAHDEKILEAIRETDQRVIRASAPRAIRALSHLIETPSHKDHARGIGMVLERVLPVETTHTVKVQHDATPTLQATAEVLRRINELAVKAGIDVSKLPPMIDVTPTGPKE